MFVVSARPPATGFIAGGVGCVPQPPSRPRPGSLDPAPKAVGERRTAAAPRAPPYRAVAAQGLAAARGGRRVPAGREAPGLSSTRVCWGTTALNGYAQHRSRTRAPPRARRPAARARRRTCPCWAA
ncbi:hypothetical protein QJS66_23120 [Kocuria rhizophila]|nr:hypothetical protein QJS66_23120 [Kocuria rhizophila]